MIDTILVDLIDTLIEAPVRPRDILYRKLGFRDPRDFEISAHEFCQTCPFLEPSEWIEEFVASVGIDPASPLGCDVGRSWQQSCHQMRPIDGAFSVISSLRSTGYKVVLVSNTTPPTRVSIDQWAIDDLVDEIVLSCDCGVRKPDPRIFEIAMRRVSSCADQTCMVGDKLSTDIRGAANAGIPGILLNSSASQPAAFNHHPTMIAQIRSIRDLPSALHRINRERRIHA